MTPTGTLRATATGVDLELTRSISASREDVWASLTDSDRTERWYGPWERVSDGEVRVQMAFEEGAPWFDMTLRTCEAPSLLAVSMGDEWHLDVSLTENDSVTTLLFIHHLTKTEGIGEIGPGWEYYLDMLIASREGAALPSFDDYYPSQQEYYESLSPR
ncbi:SRPBCC domain-containing protein [Rhodococcus sp. G-MC3]|uniref:SRPBCC domain-containing protein n=1 Tax=Rhodococcus sp. G-MC3 TaxID=3046209 RepID=UPI0024BAC292|nr:SRPBCC domain-containing protein [Rhodococcus sp. G-MC3]MDJ0394396.1 SRPBCC domain-containing protein [Rhodococcus sp. G-MC3]